MNVTFPVSLEIVERLCLGSSFPAGSASAIEMRELTAVLRTNNLRSLLENRNTGSNREEIGESKKLQ